MPNCSICFENLHFATILPCAHEFHQRCIELWKERANTCPLCRRNISEICLESEEINWDQWDTEEINWDQWDEGLYTITQQEFFDSLFL